MIVILVIFIKVNKFSFCHCAVSVTQADTVTTHYSVVLVSCIVMKSLP